jgi:hypothetical protein
MSNNKNLTQMKTRLFRNEDGKFDEQRFEFIFYINNNIICQRFFNIYDFNEDSIKSLELKDMMDNIAGMNNGEYGGLGIIPNYLREKSLTYLWGNYNPYHLQQDDSTKNIFDKEDLFQFEVKVDKKSVGLIQFSGNFFPPKVRYAVDVREIIPSIMAEIRHSMSQKNYTIVGA